MKVRKLYECTICGEAYKTATAAKRCESKSKPSHKLKPGMHVVDPLNIEGVATVTRRAGYRKPRHPFTCHHLGSNIHEPLYVLKGSDGETYKDYPECRLQPVYICRICEQQYKTPRDAHGCEKHGKPKRNFEVGNKVLWNAHDPPLLVFEVTGFGGYQQPQDSKEIRVQGKRILSTPHTPWYHVKKVGEAIVFGSVPSGFMVGTWIITDLSEDQMELFTGEITQESDRSPMRRLLPHRP